VYSRSTRTTFRAPGPPVPVQHLSERFRSPWLTPSDYGYAHRTPVSQPWFGHGVRARQAGRTRGLPALDLFAVRHSNWSDHKPLSPTAARGHPLDWAMCRGYVPRRTVFPCARQLRGAGIERDRVPVASPASLARQQRRVEEKGEDSRGLTRRRWDKM